MQEVEKDRRSAPRVSRQLPMVVRLLNGSTRVEHTVTRDLSFSGCYFYLDGETGGRREVEITLTLPPEGDNPSGIEVRYTGKVARLEPSEDGRMGVAATFANCEYLARA